MGGTTARQHVLAGDAIAPVLFEQVIDGDGQEMLDGHVLLGSQGPERPANFKGDMDGYLDASLT